MDSDNTKAEVTRLLARHTGLDLRELGSILNAMELQFRIARLSICDAWYQMAEVNYRHSIGPLPGSTRTARLRKKRRKLVIERVQKLFFESQSRLDDSQVAESE